MKLNDDFLKSIFDSDTSGLINTSLVQSKPEQTKDNYVDSKEQEVYSWIEEHGREPSLNTQDQIERGFAVRLAVMKKKTETEKPVSIDPIQDILNSDEFLNLTKDKDLGLTDFSNSILKPKDASQRNVASYVSKRTPVSDFSIYEPLFDRVQNELKSGVRKAKKFSANGFTEGKFYIAGGLLCFIEKQYETERNSFGRNDYRVHVVFANHTESYMLFTTLQKIMSEENGRVISEPNTDVLGNQKELTSADMENGYIYILSSLSTEECIKQYGKDFYKVGFTGGTVEKRISNAINEPTYLCAPVKIVEKWRCTNLNTRALETFLHKFFKVGQVKIMVNDKQKNQIASEWFNVPLEVLEATTKFILDGTIKDYYYDASIKKLRRK